MMWFHSGEMWRPSGAMRGGHLTASCALFVRLQAVTIVMPYGRGRPPVAAMVITHCGRIDAKTTRQSFIPCRFFINPPAGDSRNRIDGLCFADVFLAGHGGRVYVVHREDFGQALAGRYGRLSMLSRWELGSSCR